jgi:peptidoglycan/xylan/chitin deacetylase (PgdA/CDA1 family)
LQADPRAVQDVGAMPSNTERSCRQRRARPLRVTAAIGAALFAVLLAVLPAHAQATKTDEPPARLWRWTFPDHAKRIALLFTGHEFAEGGEVILDELKRHGAKASFFFTGDFLRRAEFAPLIRRIIGDGHYLGPHSDKHLLYCDWEDSRRTLVTREQFRRDLDDNLREVERFGVPRESVTFWVPAYEWANRDILQWSRELRLEMAGFVLAGTRANADYMCDDDPKFVSSQRIVDSVLERERADGLGGAELLMHVGAGPCRTDKLHARFGDLLGSLVQRGYAFERIDEFGRSGKMPDAARVLR